MHENYEIWTWHSAKCEEQVWLRYLILNPCAKGHTNILTLICDLSLGAKCMTISVATYRLDAWFLHSKWSSNEACYISSRGLWYALDKSRRHGVLIYLLRGSKENVFMGSWSASITARVA